MQDIAARERIYELTETYSIDLEKIFSIRQQIAPSKKHGKKVMQYWIEITLDSAKTVKINCQTVGDLQSSYKLLRLAWRQYNFDKDTEGEHELKDISEEFNNPQYDCSL